MWTSRFASGRGDVFEFEEHYYCPDLLLWINDKGVPLGPPPTPLDGCQTADRAGDYLGDVSVATWNAQAFRCLNELRACRKLAKVLKLAAKVDCMLVQEVHGEELDLRELQDKLPRDSKVFSSFGPNRAAGGVITIMNGSFCAKFDQCEVSSIAAGRHLLVKLNGT